MTGKYNDGVPAGSRASENERLRSALGGAVGQSTAHDRDRRRPGRDHGASLALAWILRRPEISSVITGALVGTDCRQCPGRRPQADRGRAERRLEILGDE
ncbi:MAG: hypothetical protein R3A10_22780 [Caldilineaceae bacterium]